MSEFEKLMLYMAFGSVIGTTIGSWIMIVHQWIDNRKKKK